MAAALLVGSTAWYAHAFSGAWHARSATRSGALNLHAFSGACHARSPTRSGTLKLQAAIATEPLDIIQSQLELLQRGADDDLRKFFSFCDLEGSFAARFANSSPDGPMTLFRSRIKREPRWKNIGQRPVAALLHHKQADIVKTPGFLDDATFQVRVRVKPWFPDAPDAEAAVLFDWLLRRQFSGSLDRPELIWRVEDIAASFDGWAVDTGVPATAQWPVVDEAQAKAEWLAKVDEQRGR